MDSPATCRFEVLKSMTAQRPVRKVLYTGDASSALTVRSLLEMGKEIANNQLGEFDQAGVFQLVGNKLWLLAPSLYSERLPDVRLPGFKEFVILIKHRPGAYGENDSSDDDGLLDAEFQADPV